MTHRATLFRCLLLTGGILGLLSGCVTLPSKPTEERFSFAVLADPRSQGETWQNALLEVRDRSARHDPAIAPAELVLVAGDMDPIVSRCEEYERVFTNATTRPVLLPVIGNHEFENGGVHFRYARDVLIPAIPGVVRRHATSCDYYVDRKNVRIIAVDGYTDLGKNGTLNDDGSKWVEQVIRETPSSVAHIFVSLHEPAFPRVRHVGDSFDQDPGLRNAFWRMLLEHRDKVRAVLVGHTHAYYRMRILNPAGPAANDPTAFPDEDGGIYQVDAGAAGNGDVNTVVHVQVEGAKVGFRVLQAKKGANMPFAEVDRWDLAPQ